MNDETLRRRWKRDTATLGEYYWDGSWAEARGAEVTVSVGVFPAVVRKAGGLRRGKVVARVYGPPNAIDRIKWKADQLAQTYTLMGPPSGPVVRLRFDQ